MHANLTEEESRVVIEKMDADPTKPFNQDDRQSLAAAQKKLTESMLSRPLSYKRYLIKQGMTSRHASERAAALVRYDS